MKVDSSVNLKSRFIDTVKLILRHCFSILILLCNTFGNTITNRDYTSHNLTDLVFMFMLVVGWFVSEHVMICSVVVLVYVYDLIVGDMCMLVSVSGWQAIIWYIHNFKEYNIQIQTIIFYFK